MGRREWDREGRRQSLSIRELPIFTPGSLLPVTARPIDDEETSAHHPALRVERRARGPVVPDIRVVDLPAEDRAVLDRLAATRHRNVVPETRRSSASYHHLRRSREAGIEALQLEAGREQLGREVERAHRSRERLVIAFLDVDRAAIAEADAPREGAEDPLAAVGVAIVAALRCDDVVVRYRPDEFLCGLPRTCLADAGPRLVAVAKRLPASRPGARFSIGLAELADGEPLDDVVRRAERDLRHALRTRAGLDGRPSYLHSVRPYLSDDVDESSPGPA